ncbi:MBL fold metallo-hydrolase [Streptomyces sp. MBT62]|uniref:MBL fold metallo-hydrolase n=1 Tax=Streptomyces sp. MBT62 TaxID=2800410 RepID=UPI0019099427|nr:MBL fold metallo-hydrolase [Streptomyces sp. MBT62]MBK3562871.1 MBL fold metallo-hydrolase [Streptomyces sp. MBT62]
MTTPTPAPTPRRVHHDDALDERVALYRVQDEVDAVVVRTERFVALVDTMSTPELCHALLREIDADLGERPLLVINTHADWDHVWGNAAVAGRAPIIAHQTAVDRLRSPRAAADLKTRTEEDSRFAAVRLVEPTLTFTDSLTLNGGDLTLELIHTPGHTDDHIAVWIPQLRLCLAGDAAEDPIPEVTDPTGADLRKLRGSLQRLRALRPLTVLPSHGETTGPELLDDNLAYFARITERVRALPPAEVEVLGRLDGPEPAGLSFTECVPTPRQLPDGARDFYEMCHRKAVPATALELGLEPQRTDREQERT